MRLIATIAIAAMTAESAYPSPLVMTPEPDPEHFWTLEINQENGQTTHYKFVSQEACEAALPRYEQSVGGNNGKCVEHKPPANPAKPYSKGAAWRNVTVLQIWVCSTQACGPNGFAQVEFSSTGTG